MTLVPNEKKRGRPKGARRKGETERWQPKVWRPVYDQIIALHIAGWSNERIAEHVEYNKQQISNILNTIEAKKIIAEQGQKIKASMMDNIIDVQADILGKTIGLTKKLLDNPDMFKEAPFATIRTGMAVSKELKEMFQPASKKEEPKTVININNQTQVNQNHLNVIEQNSDKLAEALVRAREAKLLNAGPINYSGTAGSTRSTGTQSESIAIGRSEVDGRKEKVG